MPRKATQANAQGAEASNETTNTTPSTPVYQIATLFGAVQLLVKRPDGEVETLKQFTRDELVDLKRSITSALKS